MIGTITFFDLLFSQICVKPPDHIASFFLEMPLSMHFVALILQNGSFVTTIFRNFGLRPNLGYTSKIKKERESFCISLGLH